MDYIPSNPNLKNKARQLRSRMTAAEKKMWYGIFKKEEFKKWNFHRQKPLLNFIVDFYSSKLLLAIEIDGDSHFGQKIYDQKRTKELEKYKIKIIRYFNDEILKDLDWVFGDLSKRIEERKTTLNL